MAVPASGRPAQYNAQANRKDAVDSRTRFANLMHYQPIDRVPWLEEGLRDDVLERWRDQGMPADGPTAVFTYDCRDRIQAHWGLGDSEAIAPFGGLVRDDTFGYR